MKQNNVDKILVDRAIDAASKESIQSEMNLLRVNPAYQDLSEDELKKIAFENCKASFEEAIKQRAFIKPITNIKER